MLQAVPHAVQHEEDQQGDAGTGQQHQQGLPAVARDDAIEDLQHEERGHDEQQVHDERERGQGAQQWPHSLP